MTGVNHMLVGGIIGASVGSPLAIPLAVISHFVLDALPHYGIDEDTPRSADMVWKYDIGFVVIFIVSIFFMQPDVRLWAVVGAFCAFAPDLAWVYRYSVQERFGRLQPKEVTSRFNHFHSSIQKYEAVRHLWIEAVFLVCMGGIFYGMVL